jgi:hypothetical protein
VRALCGGERQGPGHYEHQTQAHDGARGAVDGSELCAADSCGSVHDVADNLGIIYFVELIFRDFIKRRRDNDCGDSLRYVRIARKLDVRVHRIPGNFGSASGRKMARCYSRDCVVADIVHRARDCLRDSGQPDRIHR